MINQQLFYLRIFLRRNGFDLILLTKKTVRHLYPNFDRDKSYIANGLIKDDIKIFIICNQSESHIIYMMKKHKTKKDINIQELIELLNLQHEYLQYEIQKL